MTHTLAHLADLYNKENKRDIAYSLWKRALAADDDAPKDVIIYNILEYDIEHGNADNVLEKVSEIMEIKDSIERKLANDTLKDLQLRFDHEVEKHRMEQQINKSLYAIIALTVIVMALGTYILLRRYRLRLLWSKTQIQIDNYMAEIQRLKKSGSDRQREVAELQARIKALTTDHSQQMSRGLLLYNEVKDNGTMVKWSKEDYEAFINYYDAIDHPTVKQHRKEHKKLTPRNLAFLLLVDMGKSDEDIRQIMSLSPEGLRSIRYRLNHQAKE